MSAPKFSDLEKEEGAVVHPSFEALIKEEGAKLHEEPKASHNPEYSKLESAGKGIVEGGSFGLGPRIGAGLQKSFNEISNWRSGKTDEQEKAEGDATFRDALKENRAENQMAKDAHPWAYGAGNVAGSVATLPALPGGVAAKGAGLVARLAARAGAGALQGGIQGAGESNADLHKGEYGQFARDVGAGGAVGGVLGTGLGVVGEGVKAGYGALRPLAERAAGRAVGVTKKMFKNLDNKGTVHQFGRDLLDNKILGNKSLEEIAKGTDDLKQLEGGKIHDFLRAADNPPKPGPVVSTTSALSSKRPFTPSPETPKPMAPMGGQLPNGMPVSATHPASAQLVGGPPVPSMAALEPSSELAMRNSLARMAVTPTSRFEKTLARRDYLGPIGEPPPFPGEPLRLDSGSDRAAAQQVNARSPQPYHIPRPALSPGSEEEANFFSPAKAAQRIEKDVIRPLRQSPANEAVGNSIQAEADKLKVHRNNRPMSFQSANELKNSYNPYTKFNADPIANFKANQMQGVRRGIRDEIDAGLDKAAENMPEGALSSFKESRRLYGSMADASNAVHNKIQNEAAKQYVASPITLKALAGHLIPDREPQITAAMLDKLGSMPGPIRDVLTRAAQGGKQQLIHAAVPGGAEPTLNGSELNGQVPDSPHLPKASPDAGPTENFANTPDKPKAHEVLRDTLEKNPQAMGKFAAPLQKAMQRGPEAMAATHFSLHQTSPEYRAMHKNLTAMRGDQSE